MALVHPAALIVLLKNERKPSPSMTWPVKAQPLPLPVMVPSSATVSDSGAVVRVSSSFTSVCHCASPVHVPTMAPALGVAARFALVPVDLLAAQNATPS